MEGIGRGGGRGREDGEEEGEMGVRGKMEDGVLGGEDGYGFF